MVDVEVAANCFALFQVPHRLAQRAEVWGLSLLQDEQGTRIPEISASYVLNDDVGNWTRLIDCASAREECATRWRWLLLPHSNVVRDLKESR